MLESAPMNTSERPTFYYLVIHGAKTIIEESSDVEMQKRYERGVRWRGVPAKTRAEAEEALQEINASGQ